MKNFIVKTIVFLLPGLVYSLAAIIFMPYFLSLANGPSTKQQITQSFENSIKKEYETLILGNSRTYRGLNPEVFSLKTFNFSHDNDSYNQIYYKLKFLIDNEKKINYLLLSVDYFQFSFKSDTRNYVYADFFDKEYMYDFEDSEVWIKKIEYHLGNINPKKTLLLKPKRNKPFLKENGQYIKPGFASENDTITRDISRLDFQVKYFEKTLELCKKKDIKVVMLFLPTRKNELKSYTSKEIEEFDHFIQSYVDNVNIFCLNFSKIDGFKTEDYTDITHLNEKAANRFSIILNKELMTSIIDKK